MRKVWALYFTMLWGAIAWGDPPPIHPHMPTSADLAAPRDESIKPRRHSDAETDSGSRTTPKAPAATLEPQQASPSNPTGEETSGSGASGGEDGQSPETAGSDVVLDFRTRELMELKRIARELGGNLVISIEPRGISPADLIVPLKNSGLFEVSAKDKSFLVTSSGEGQKREMEREIAALARRQAALLRNIEVLEAMRSEERIPEAKDEAGERNKPSIAEQEEPSASERADYPLPKK